MERQNLIQRLVDRKLQTAVKSICWNCVCIASPNGRVRTASADSQGDKAAGRPEK